MLKDLIEQAGFSGLIKGRYGYYLFNKNDLFIGKSVSKYGEWSEGEVKLFRQICQPNDVVIEVGANIGIHTLVLAQLVGKQGRVFAFEPQRIAFQTLCGNMAVNSIDNAECFQLCVSNEAGEMLVPQLDYNKPNNFGGVSLLKIKEGTRVPAIKLDDFLNVPSVRLIKVDVEGLEKEVLLGAKSIIEKHKPFLYVENDRKETAQELIALIKSFNYKLYWHNPFIYNPENYAQDKENIFNNFGSRNMICFHESLDLNMTGFKKVEDDDISPYEKHNI